MVISHPSSEDDLNGELGTGKLGLLLQRLLSDAGIQKDACTITSAIRCTPLYNYSKYIASIDACRAYLIDLIYTLNPTEILALGNNALISLTKKSGIKNHRGKMYSLHKEYGHQASVWATYGLEDIQRNPIFYKTIVSDLRNSLKSRGVTENITFSYWE